MKGGVSTSAVHMRTPVPLSRFPGVSGSTVLKFATEVEGPTSYAYCTIKMPWVDPNIACGILWVHGMHFAEICCVVKSINYAL